MSSGDIALAIAVLGVLGTLVTAYLTFRGKKEETTESAAERVDKQESELRNSLFDMNKELQEEAKKKSINIAELEQVNRNLKIQNVELLEQNNLLLGAKATLLTERDELRAQVASLKAEVAELRAEVIEYMRKGKTIPNIPHPPGNGK